MAATGLRKGGWTEEEDILLRNCIHKYGEVKWHQVPHRAGLNRCRKSCRLRWLNYLRPDIKRGSFAHDEVDLIIRLHKLLGNRWSLIAGRIPGRTANDVKNYWNTHRLKKSVAPSTEVGKSESKNEITRTAAIKPRPRTFTALKLKSTVDHQCLGEKPIDPSPAPLPAVDDGVEWWDKLSFDDEMIIGDGIIWPDWG